MDWSRIKEEIYFEDGSLRDIITDTDDMSLKKWKLLCDFLQANYELRVLCDGNDMEVDFDFSLAEKMLFDENHCYIATLCICNVNLNLYFSFGHQRLEFDISPNEVDSLDKHTAILGFMVQLANVLQMSIKMTGENWPEPYLLKANPTTV